MAAINPRINNKEDTQTTSNGIKLSKPTLHALPSSGRFKDVAKRVIATSTRGSSTGMHHDAPPSLHPSESRSSSSGKGRRNSLSDVAAHAINGVKRTASECPARNDLSTTGRKDYQNSLANSHVGSTSDLGLHRKLISGNLASTSSKVRDSRDAATTSALARVAETDQKSHARIRDSATQHRTNELCKDCRSRISRMESVCFITNDGRISAAPTSALHARHSHHCNMRGCAGNIQNHRQPASVPSSRRDSLSRRKASLNPHPIRRKSVLSLSQTGSDHGSAASSVQGDAVERQEADSSLRGSAGMSSTAGSDTLDMKKEIDLKEVLIKRSSELDDAESCVNTNSSSQTPIDENGRLDAVFPCQESSSSCLRTTQVPIDQESYVENTRTENVEARSSPAASSILSDIHGDDDDDDDKGSAYIDDMQTLNDFQGLISYHGDNEYSCSESGTDVTTTPVSSSKGAFDDLSNIDIEPSHSENGISSRSRRSAIARITRKYLESLTEQEAEKVRLRKQEILARRQAGDWMMDCHMEEVLHRLAPNGEAHVKVLVEAFETVMNQSDSDCSQTAHCLDQEHVEALRHTVASS